MTWEHLSHWVNLGKYVSAILVVVFSFVQGKSRTSLSCILRLPLQIRYHHCLTCFSLANGTQFSSWTNWNVVWLISVIVKTVYCSAWDIYMDWDLGILNTYFPSTRPSSLVLPHPQLISMVCSIFVVLLLHLTFVLM